MQEDMPRRKRVILRKMFDCGKIPDSEICWDFLCHEEKFYLSYQEFFTQHDFFGSSCGV